MYFSVKRTKNVTRRTGPLAIYDVVGFKLLQNKKQRKKPILKLFNKQKYSVYL